MLNQAKSHRHYLIGNTYVMDYIEPSAAPSDYTQIKNMRIAILGATSQIARDFILLLAANGFMNLSLFSRRPDAVKNWLADHQFDGSYPAEDFDAFTLARDFDAIINFVGIGSPVKAAAMGAAILDTTFHYDSLVLDYLRHRPACRYIFLSSGAAYGGTFATPAQQETKSIIAINDIQPQDWYGVAKLHTECRHRAHFELPIVDVRLFSYFSRGQDLSSRFLLSDIADNILKATEMTISPDYIVRDFLHPKDFFNLIASILSAAPANAALDCYSKAPVDKPSLVAAMQKSFGLKTTMTGTDAGMNATGTKVHYYSLNKKAKAFGYIPSKTSLEGVMEEMQAILGNLC